MGFLLKHLIFATLDYKINQWTFKIQNYNGWELFEYFLSAVF